MTNNTSVPEVRSNSARQQELLFKTLFGGLAGCIGLFSSVAGQKKESGSIEVLRMRAGYFTYPQQEPNALQWAERAAKGGRELHICPHLLTKRRRVKENATEIKALWADADDAKLPDNFPEPTISVQSSPGNRHLYWALRTPLTPQQAEAYNRRLTYTIGADPGGWPLAALMRLPGTENQKYPGHTPIGILSYDVDLRYHPREIDQYLVADTKDQEAIPMAKIPDVRAKDPDGQLLTIDDLDQLSPKIRGLIATGNQGPGNPYKSNSEADFAVVVAMLGRGFTEEAIYEVLKDPANGISTAYRTRGRFGEQYLRITIEEAKSRGQRPYPPPASGNRHSSRKPLRNRHTPGEKVA